MYKYVTVSVVWKYFLLPEVVKIFSQINISVVLQSQIIQKHLHVDYNPLKLRVVSIRDKGNERSSMLK
jgi:hypothetical protein